MRSFRQFSRTPYITLSRMRSPLKSTTSSQSTAADLSSLAVSSRLCTRGNRATVKAASTAYSRPWHRSSAHSRLSTPSPAPTSARQLVSSSKTPNCKLESRQHRLPIKFTAIKCCMELARRHSLRRKWMTEVQDCLTKRTNQTFLASSALEMLIKLSGRTPLGATRKTKTKRKAKKDPPNQLVREREKWVARIAHLMMLSLTSSLTNSWLLRKT